MVRDIAAFGGCGQALQADVSLASDVRRLVDEALAGFGRLDVVINNAGEGDVRVLEKASTSICSSGRSR